MFFWAMMACTRCTAAAAESRLATVWSSTDCDTLPFFTSVDWRA